MKLPPPPPLTQHYYGTKVVVRECNTDIISKGTNTAKLYKPTLVSW